MAARPARHVLALPECGAPGDGGANARALVLDMHRLISMDTSGLDALEQLQRCRA